MADKVFEFTEKQLEAMKIIAGQATHVMLYGGSRSGKTFLHVRNIILRALKAPDSHHCILRFRFNHLKASVILGTFPKVMKLCFPDVEYVLSKTDWYVKFPNGSELWFGGLDEKERTEKILGQEYSTILFNESSQIPKGARIVVLDERGTHLTTQALAGKLKDWQLGGDDVALVIDARVASSATVARTRQVSASAATPGAGADRSVL